MTGSLDLTVRVWDAVTGAEIRILRGHRTRPVQCASFSPDGLLVASGSMDELPGYGT